MKGEQWRGADMILEIKGDQSLLYVYVYICIECHNETHLYV